MGHRGISKWNLGLPCKFSQCQLAAIADVSVLIIRGCTDSDIPVCDALATPTDFPLMGVRDRWVTLTEHGSSRLATALHHIDYLQRMEPCNRLRACSEITYQWHSSDTMDGKECIHVSTKLTYRLFFPKSSRQPARSIIKNKGQHVNVRQTDHICICTDNIDYTNSHCHWSSKSN